MDCYTEEGVSECQKAFRKEDPLKGATEVDSLY